MDIKFYKDGSFDISCGAVELRNAYPAVDGVPVRPTAVEASESGARYILADGILEIRARIEEDRIAIYTKVTGLAKAHDIAPVAAAKLTGCDRVFAQGLGMGGPSGFHTVSEKDVLSHGIFAAGGKDGCAALYARDQARLHNFYTSSDGVIAGGFDTECLPVPDGELPVIYIRGGNEFSKLLRDCARDIADTMHARKVTEPAFHWCSWYYLYHTLDQQTLEEYLEGFGKHRDIAPFSHIQIDAGYFRSCGDWLDKYERFPKGLKYAADTIKAAGYEPGIWIGPFMVGDNSILYREHPDWMLKSADGGYVRPWIQYNEPKPWGYRDSDYFVLDTSVPEAMEYLRHVFATLREWGYTLFKTDFLFWGLQDSSKVIRHTPGKTSFEYFRDVMRMIRETIGDDARWLGCISPFMPALGYTDMMRIAGDVGAQWEENAFGPVNMLNEITADQYFNNIYWQNDPDAIMLRDFHIHLKPNQVEALALLEAMSGGTMYTSEPIHLISEERRELLKFVRPNGLHDPEYPFWGDMRDDVCLIQRLRTRTLVYFFNPTSKDIIRPFDWLKYAGERAEYVKKRGGRTERAENVKYIEIPAQSGVLYYASDKPIEHEPDNIWEDE